MLYINCPNFQLTLAVYCGNEETYAKHASSIAAAGMYFIERGAIKRLYKIGTTV